MTHTVKVITVRLKFTHLQPCPVMLPASPAPPRRSGPSDRDHPSARTGGRSFPFPSSPSALSSPWVEVWVEDRTGMNILYWIILTDWFFCTGISLLTEHAVLEYPYWLIFCTGISLLTGYFVMGYSYWLNMLYWHIPSGNGNGNVELVARLGWRADRKMWGCGPKRVVLGNDLLWVFQKKRRFGLDAKSKS